jgi:hypothetical protein
MSVATHSRAPLYAAWHQRYDVVRKIGAGGFAEVYEAVDLELDREVALKVVDERRVLSVRVVREVEAAAALDHPGIVSLFDFFTDGERSFLVWELVRGQSLAELADELDDAEAVLALAQACDALAYAHSRGVVHRDVKPQNVMVDVHGRVKVMDFGIARLIDAETLTSEGEMLGTVAYMSPEQAAGRRAGPPSDVYSAGLVLYELLSGENPLRGATPAETVGRVLAGRLPSLGDLRPDLPSELVDAVDVACATRVADRPTAVELAEALRAVVDRLGGRRFRPQRLKGLVAPFTRLGTVAERATGAGLAFVALTGLLIRLPAYPPAWTLPLAATAALVWVFLPPFGLALLLGLLVFPMFNVSLGAGGAWLVLSAALVVAGRRRPTIVVWPVLGLALAPFSGTLLGAAAAAVFGRRRGPLAAAWAGLVTYMVLTLSGAAPGPFTLYQPASDLGLQISKSDDPLRVAGLVLGATFSWPVFVQVVAWACLAVVLAAGVRLARIELRLWSWALGFAALFIVYRTVPIVVWGLAAPAGDLALAVVVAAAVCLPPVVAGPALVARVGSDGDGAAQADDDDL